MKVWLVEKRGVYYHHGILGVFKSMLEARACAEAAVKDPGETEYHWDGDGHHTYVLMCVELESSDHAPMDVAELHSPAPKVHNREQHRQVPGVPYRWRTL